MKGITMFTMASCPYCRKAHAWMDELFAADPSFRDIPLTIVDEVEHPEIADRYNYYYVPTYFVDGEKLHEGAASMEIIHKVFDAAKAGQ